MIKARKSLGQHFLRDSNITAKIVRLCGDITATHIVEIGPGPGALTHAILGARPLSYTGIEKDERFFAPLQALFSQPEYTAIPCQLVHADALKYPLPEHTPSPRAIIANLPYNVGTEMLIRWLKEIQHYRFLTLMFQKEVVDRIAAEPNTKDYGRLSILAQWLCEVEPLFEIPPGAFLPPPKVMSSVVRLTPRAAPLPCSLPLLEKVTAAAFGQRRKMLRVSLKPLGGELLLEKAGISPTLRAENLSVSQFIQLATLLEA